MQLALCEEMGEKEEMMLDIILVIGFLVIGFFLGYDFGFDKGVKETLKRLKAMLDEVHDNDKD